jgi:hypothetical protein
MPGPALAYESCPEEAERGRASAPPVVAGAAIMLALAGTVWLWGAYGATVFFETIRAGFVTCFG